MPAVLVNTLVVCSSCGTGRKYCESVDCFLASGGFLEYKTLLNCELLKQCEGHCMGILCERDC